MPPGGGMYNFKPLSTPQQLSQQGGAPTGVPHPGSGGMSAGPGVPMSNGGGPPPGISVGPNGQLVGPGGTPLNPQQLQGIIPQSLQQQFRAYQAARGAAGHTPIQPLGMGGSPMQINPSQLSNAQAAMGVGGSQMGPPTGMTAPGRMGGAIAPVNPTGQWMNRIGASGPQRPARYQQDPTDILTKQKLQELIRQVAPNDRLEPEVEELLQDIAEDFVESVTTFACSLAKLRKSDCLDAKDVALHLERNWNLQIPGYSPELDVMSMASGSPTLTQSTVASLKRPLPEGHKQRLALVKKTMALQRKREEKEREKERKQREDQKERGKQQLQAQQQAEKQQPQRTEASSELEKKAMTPDLETEVKKEKSETEKSEAAAAAAGDEATTEKKEKKDNEEAEEEEVEEEGGEIKEKKRDRKSVV